MIDKEKDAGRPGLQIEDLSVKNSHGSLGLRDFSLTVRGGEIVGIAGVDGNGQSELVEAITGLRRAEKGKILLNGEEITHETIARRIRRGVSHIPEDRQKRGLVLDYTVEENMVLEVYGQRPSRSTACSTSARSTTTPRGSRTISTCARARGSSRGRGASAAETSRRRSSAARSKSSPSCSSPCSQPAASTWGRSSTSTSASSTSATSGGRSCSSRWSLTRCSSFPTGSSRSTPGR
ncbi:MAG: ATP-binding cassette domain-containing protein [Anaerotruncus massiliensis (ex Togo et al. 2019)]